VATVVGLSLAFGGAAVGVSFSGPLGLGLIALAMLACPVSMGVIIWRQGRSKQKASPAAVLLMVNCCLPGETLAAIESGNPGERLAELRARREALERELAELLVK
jgi:uncharacterized membrane protein YqjE